MNSNGRIATNIVDGADTAWVIISSILMMLMTPGVGILYGGIVRQKNMLTVLIQSVAIFALISVLWALLGFSLAFGKTSGHFIGDSTYFGFRDIGELPMEYAPTIPGLIFFFYQLCACAVTPAIVVGSAAERFAILPSLLFSAIWLIIVYCPVAHWVWGDGWLNKLGTIDYAGGVVVHMCAGYSSLALSLAIGKRVESHDKICAHNNTYVFLGTVLLWFGWFGFNGGSSFQADYQAVLAVVSTNMSACTAALTWAAVEYLFNRKLSLVSFVLGAGCGLISMTPGSGYCPPWASLIIGVVGGALSCCHSILRSKYQCFDDATDVFSAHGISGTWGVFAVGLWAKASEDGVDGGFYGRGVQLGYQMAAIVSVGPYCLVLTFLIAYCMKRLGLLRVSKEDEEAGLDTVHGEYAYIIVPISPGPSTHDGKVEPAPSMQRIKELNGYSTQPSAMPNLNGNQNSPIT